MQNETRKTMRINTVEFQLYEVSRINRFIDTDKYLTLGITEMLILSNGHRISEWVNGKVQQMDSGASCTIP